MGFHHLHVIFPQKCTLILQSRTNMSSLGQKISLGNCVTSTVSVTFIRTKMLPFQKGVFGLESNKHGLPFVK